MLLEERKCPNCESGQILEKDGTFVCMNCRTFFDKPQDVIVTHVERDETEIERIKSAERLEIDRRNTEEKRKKRCVRMESCNMVYHRNFHIVLPFLWRSDF